MERSSHHAELSFSFDSETEANAVESALLPEMRERVQRSQAHLLRTGSVVTVTIEAEDTASLRAAIHSYLRWVKTAGEVAEKAHKNANR